MKERPHHSELAFSFAEVMYMVMESEYQNGERSLDASMKRLKDLSAYSLTHAEILQQKEGVELLALGMLFGMSTETAYRKNQERLAYLSEDAFTYQGQAEKIEQEIADRKAQPKKKSGPPNPQQPRLL